MSDPRVDLARRLRALRDLHWPDLRVTQQHLAEAFGQDGRPLSVSLISSWESTQNPAALHRPTGSGSTRSSSQPGVRWSARARGCWTNATSRRTSAQRATGSTPNWLNSGIRTRRREPSTVRMPLAAPGDEIGGGLLHFPDQKPITIVCSRLPDELRRSMPYTNRRDPDYVRSYSYADIDSLIELFGHVRAVNPTAVVNIRAADSLEEDDFTAH